MVRGFVRHITDGARWSYFAQAALGSIRPARKLCPNCGCRDVMLLKRKYLVTALARCSECRILYRVPTDSADFNAAFYQTEYTSGFTTDCPSRAVLSKMLTDKFAGTPKDFSSRIALLSALGVKPGQRILDYGASWGYGTWQLKQAGYDVVGYEVSRPRARYAREMLDVEVYDQLGDLHGPFDVVFSCHVLEHVARPSAVLKWARTNQRSGGLFVAITPNGSEAYLRADPRRFHRHWGRVHPFYLNDEFYGRSFMAQPTLLASAPYDLVSIGRWNRESHLALSLTGWELLVATVV